MWNQQCRLKTTSDSINKRQKSLQYLTLLPSNSAKSASLSPVIWTWYSNLSSGRSEWSECTCQSANTGCEGSVQQFLMAFSINCNHSWHSLPLKWPCTCTVATRSTLFHHSLFKRCTKFTHKLIVKHEVHIVVFFLYVCVTVCAVCNNAQNLCVHRCACSQRSQVYNYFYVQYTSYVIQYSVTGLHENILCSLLHESALIITYSTWHLKVSCIDPWVSAYTHLCSLFLCGYAWRQN